MDKYVVSKYIMPKYLLGHLGRCWDVGLCAALFVSVSLLQKAGAAVDALCRARVPFMFVQSRIELRSGDRFSGLNTV